MHEKRFQLYIKAMHLVGNGRKDGGCRLLGPSPETKAPEKESLSFIGAGSFPNLLARSFQEERDLLDQAHAPEITPTISHMKILRMNTWEFI